MTMTIKFGPIFTWATPTLAHFIFYLITGLLSNKTLLALVTSRT